MGKLNYDEYIYDTTHPHPLQLSNPQLSTYTCSACKLQPSGWMYSCMPCRFTLHIKCTNLPTSIRHPSHFHPLKLLPAPAYSVGSFNCDACGHQGHGFSYHCAYCDFDVHTTCASNPLSLTHHSHLHVLSLAFSPPYPTKGFSCDVCHTMGSNHWLYRCGPCEFDAHMDCLMATFRPVPPARIQLQHQYSFPGASGSNQQSLMNPYNLHCQGIGTMQSSYQQQGVLTTNGLMDTAVQGFVEGAAQQVGQDFVQNICGDHDIDASGEVGGGGTPSVFGVASSVLSGIFGSSETSFSVGDY